MIAKFIQEFAYVNALEPKADRFDTAGESDVISAKDAEEVVFHLKTGAAAATTHTVTVESCDDTTPTTTTAIPFAYSKTTTEGSPGAVTAATASGFALTTASANQHYLICVDPADIEAANSHAGDQFCRLVVTENEDVAQLGDVSAFVRTKRKQDQVASVIA